MATSRAKKATAKPAPKPEEKPAETTATPEEKPAEEAPPPEQPPLNGDDAPAEGQPENDEEWTPDEDEGIGAPAAENDVNYSVLPWAEYGQAINDRFRQVVKQFVYTSDMRTFGEIDHWGIPKEDLKGKIHDDCDGFAFFCYDKLRETIPDIQNHASPIICQVETGEWHMVLGIYTDAGVKCMDNRQTGVLDLTALMKAGYKTFYRPPYGYPLDAEWEGFRPTFD